MQTIETPGVQPTWGWRDVAAVILFLVVGGAVMIIALRTVAAATRAGSTDNESLTSPLAYIAGVGVYALLVLGVYVFAARRAGWAALGLRAVGWRHILLVPPLFILGIILLVLVNTGIALITGGTFENPQVDALTGGNALAPQTLVALLLLVAVLAPFAEELFFRGMLYPLLRYRLGPVGAIVVNAALFAGAHFIPLLMPGLFAVGLLLAFLRERSGSIWPSIMFHVLQNTLALVAINAALSGAS